jgi:hypothetical protein
MARKKAFIGAAISLGTSIVGGLMSSAAKRRQQEEQQRQQEAVYRAKEGSNIASSYNQQHANDYDLSLENERLYTSSLFKGGGSIHIKDSKKGTFTAAAKKRGQSVQGFASKVLANKDNYSPAMVKKAVFAHNAPKWKHRLGGVVNTLFRKGGKVNIDNYENINKELNMGSFTLSPIYDNNNADNNNNNKYNNKSEDYISKRRNNKRTNEIQRGDNKVKQESKRNYNTRNRRINSLEKSNSNIYNIHNNDSILYRTLQNNKLRIFRLGGGTKLKATKRATKQNLGLENANKVGVNAPTAYRRLATESSQPSRTILSSEDKVVQKALESAISTSPVKEVDDTRTTYKGDGKADVNNIITEGGDAKRIGHQTFLLRGRKHRNGGIVLGKGRNAIEAEGGEVVKIDKNTMKILSTVPMANGESPANRVLKGESPDKVFDSQEQFKDRNNLNNNSYERMGFNRKDNSRSNGNSYMENGGTGNLHSSKSNSNINTNKIIKEDKMKRSRSSLLGRRKAALGDYLNLAGDAFNIISPLLGGNRTKRAINRMVAPTQPTQLQATNLRTTYNIQPQLTDVYNAEQQSIAETNRNTASSVAAQARGTRLRQLGLNQRNQLRGQQQNIETQLINQNRLNRQQVTNQNIAATNDWRDRVSQFVNDQIVSKANIDNQIIENVSAGIRDLQLRGDKNRQERNALTAIMASNPEQVNLFMKKRKEYENLLDRNSRSLLRPYRCGGSVKRKMKR